jgi:hypothetical protein
MVNKQTEKQTRTRTAHTPGPWHIIRTDRGNLTVSYTFGALRSHICTCYETALCTEHGSVDANAALISAAPELLEACKALLAHDPIHPQVTCKCPCPACQARAAIAKAEGMAT